jgi:SAM-dependent methyltransferase
MDDYKLYKLRFSPYDRRRKEEIWRILCEKFFQSYIKESDTVLDLGAGFCDFINHIKCKKRIAVDTNPDVKNYANSGIRVLVADSSNLGEINNSSIDIVFTSNFFEHLNTKAELIQTLQEIRRILCRGGKLLVLQPNIRYIGGKYWDFLDHNLPITDRTLIEAFGLIGLQVVEVRSRFLPYSTKSRFPQSPLLVRLYLAIPLAHRIIGEQAWIVGLKTE